MNGTMRGSESPDAVPKMGFEEAFREINGHAPTQEQIRNALTLQRVLDEAQLNPVLLSYLVDMRAQAAREKALEEIRRATVDVEERLRKTVPSVENAEKSIGALQGVRSMLESLTTCTREVMRLGTLLGVVVAMLWTLSLIATWRTAYAWGRNDAMALGHRVMCNDLNEHIAAMSAHWRKMGFRQAADRLGASYDQTCR